MYGEADHLSRDQSLYAELSGVAEARVAVDVLISTIRALTLTVLVLLLLSTGT